MHANDLAISMRTVTLTDSVSTAVKVLATSGQPGLIIVDDENRPQVVLPGTQVLRMCLALGFSEDAALARAVDEKHADGFWQDQSHRSIADCLPAKSGPKAIVGQAATLLEVASLMARLHNPLVAVVGDDDGRLVGGITLRDLLDHRVLPDSPA